MFPLKVELSLAAALLLLLSKWASATDRVVTNTSDSGPGSLREAIELSADGDSISFAVQGTVNSNPLEVSKSITINGPGARNLAISGQGGNRVFWFKPGT